MGLNLNVIKVGNDNLFQSEVFATTISSILDCEIHMLNTTGAVGAAKAAGAATGVYSNLNDAFTSEKTRKDLWISWKSWGVYQWLPDLES